MPRNHTSAKRAGSRFQAEVADYLAELLPSAYVERLRGVNDRGDIGGVAGVTMECKNESSIDLATMMNEAATEAANAHNPTYVGIQKRRSKPVAESYVVMPLWKWRELLDHRANGVPW